MPTAAGSDLGTRSAPHGGSGALLAPLLSAAIAKPGSGTARGALQQLGAELQPWKILVAGFVPGIPSVCR